MPRPIWRVVVADDHADTRDLYAQVLALMHFEVATAANGADALAICLADPPHVLIADLRMPKMNGYELLDALRKHEHTRDIPAIATSASLSEEARALGHGFESFCAKPCDPQKLTLTVVSILLKSAAAVPTGSLAVADIPVQVRASGTGVSSSAGGRRSSARATRRGSSPRHASFRSTSYRRQDIARTTARSPARS